MGMGLFHARSSLGTDSMSDSPSWRRIIRRVDLDILCLLLLLVIIRPLPLSPVPPRHPRPRTLPGKRAIIANIQLLILARVRDGRPLAQVRIQLGAADLPMHLPGIDIPREDEGLAEVCADTRVDGQGEDGVHGRVGHGADDDRRHDDGPRCVLRGAVLPEGVFLGKIEVGFVLVGAGVGLFHGGFGGASVDAVGVEWFSISFSRPLAAFGFSSLSRVKGGCVKARGMTFRPWEDVPVVFSTSLKQETLRLDVGDRQCAQEVVEDGLFQHV